MHSTTVIVPHHSNRTGLEFCLKSLRETIPREVEIIVIANNSRIDHAATEFAEQYGRVVRIEKNLGYSGAINLGVQEAKGSLLVFCDDDIITTPNWLASMKLFHEASDCVGATAAKLISPFTGRIVDYGIAFTQFNAPHVFQDQLPRHPLTLIRRRVQAVCSALMMIDKALFEEVGGFSVKRQSHYSDLELCLKINQRGKESWVLGDVICYHRSSYVTKERALYKGTEIKGDAKANFFQNFGDLIKIDLDRYYIESLRGAVLKDLLVENEYVLLSMANVMDLDWYHDIFTDLFKVNSIYELPTYQRDADHLPLIDQLGSNFLVKNSPFLYFVDRFTSLRDNAHWFRHRPAHRDVVIDRNANILNANDLFSEPGSAQDISNVKGTRWARSPSANLKTRLTQARHLVEDYENTTDYNDEVWIRFANLTNAVPGLRIHRDYVEANEWGFGDRSFHMMWAILLDDIRRGRKCIQALEIGVFKGQVLSLWHLIGRLLGVDVHSVGISPFRGSEAEKGSETTLDELRRAQSYYEDSDYYQDVLQIFRDFALNTGHVSLLPGLSQDDDVVRQISNRVFDIVYIDGDHRLASVRHDLKTFQRFVRLGGYLVVDDAALDLPGSIFWKGLPSVTTALSELDWSVFQNKFNVGHNRVFQRIAE